MKLKEFNETDKSQIFYFMGDIELYNTSSKNLIKFDLLYDLKDDSSVPTKTLDVMGANMDHYEKITWKVMLDELRDLVWLDLEGIDFIVFNIENILQDWDKHFRDFQGLLSYFTLVANFWKEHGITVKVFFKHNLSFFKETAP